MDPDPIFIALGTRDGQQVYTLIHHGKRLETFGTVTEAVRARVKLEKQIKEETS